MAEQDLLHQTLATVGTLRERRLGLERQWERHGEQVAAPKRKIAEAESRCATLVAEGAQLDDEVTVAARSRDGSRLSFLRPRERGTRQRSH
jgi:hypothetical protein